MTENRIVYKDSVFEDLCREIDSMKVCSPSSSFEIRFLHRCPRQQVLHTRRSEKNIDLNPILHECSIKNKWVKIFGTCKRVRVVDSDVTVCDARCNISSKLDIIIEFQDKIYVVYVVCLHDNVFNAVKIKGPMRKDIITMQAYIWLSEINDGILIYENIKDMSYDLFFIRKNKSMTDSIESRLIDLSKHQVSGTVPNIPCDIKISECNACEYRSECDKIELLRRNSCNG